MFFRRRQLAKLTSAASHGLANALPTGEIGTLYLRCVFLFSDLTDKTTNVFSLRFYLDCNLETKSTPVFTPNIHEGPPARQDTIVPSIGLPCRWQFCFSPIPQMNIRSLKCKGQGYRYADLNSFEGAVWVPLDFCTLFQVCSN